MPNRLLYESVKTSNEIDQLSWFEEVVFYRLITTVDDYGCYDGRVIVLKNELFPTKETVTTASIRSALEKLERAKLLVRYESDGKPYIYLPTWGKHQRIRNKKRKYPIPPQLSDICQSNDSQLTANCQSESKSTPNPIRIQSESEIESNPTLLKQFPGLRYRPNIDDVRDYIAVKGYHFSAEEFMDYYDRFYWTGTGGKPIANWMACCPTFERNWKEKQERQQRRKGPATVTIPVPDYIRDQTRREDQIDFDSLPGGDDDDNKKDD